MTDWAPLGWQKTLLPKRNWGQHKVPLGQSLEQIGAVFPIVQRVLADPALAEAWEDANPGLWLEPSEEPAGYGPQPPADRSPEPSPGEPPSDAPAAIEQNSLQPLQAPFLQPPLAPPAALGQTPLLQPSAEPSPSPSDRLPIVQPQWDQLQYQTDLASNHEVATFPEQSSQPTIGPSEIEEIQTETEDPSASPTIQRQEELASSPEPSWEARNPEQLTPSEELAVNPPLQLQSEPLPPEPTLPEAPEELSVSSTLQPQSEALPAPSEELTVNPPLQSQSEGLPAEPTLPETPAERPIATDLQLQSEPLSPTSAPQPDLTKPEAPASPKLQSPQIEPESAVQLSSDSIASEELSPPIDPEIDAEPVNRSPVPQPSEDEPQADLVQRVSESFPASPAEPTDSALLSATPTEPDLAVPPPVSPEATVPEPVEPATPTSENEIAAEQPAPVSDALEINPVQAALLPTEESTASFPPPEPASNRSPDMESIATPAPAESLPPPIADPEPAIIAQPEPLPETVPPEPPSSTSVVPTDATEVPTVNRQPEAESSELLASPGVDQERDFPPSLPETQPDSEPPATSPPTEIAESLIQRDVESAVPRLDPVLPILETQTPEEPEYQSAAPPDLPSEPRISPEFPPSLPETTPAIDVMPAAGEENSLSLPISLPISEPLGHFTPLLPDLPTVAPDASLPTLVPPLDIPVPAADRAQSEFPESAQPPLSGQPPPPDPPPSEPAIPAVPEQWDDLSELMNSQPDLSDTPVVSVPAVPEQWNDLSELMGSQPETARDTWESAFDLGGDAPSPRFPEDQDSQAIDPRTQLISPGASPEADDSGLTTISAHDPPGVNTETTITSGLTGQVATPSDQSPNEEQLERLAHQVYSLIRQQFVYDWERSGRSQIGHLPWLGSLVPAYTGSQSFPVERSHTATPSQPVVSPDLPSPVDSYLYQLSHTIHALLQHRIAIDRERVAHCRY